MPVPAVSLLNNLISFTAKSSVQGGGYGGSVELTNENDQYDNDTMRWTQMQVSLAATVNSDLADDSCLSGSVSWISGVIHDVSRVFGISENAVSLKIKSYYAEFKRKPVTTEYYDDTVANVMTEVATIFGGIPAALIDFSSITGRNVYAVVSGNNLLDELMKLANVGLADMFVQRDGKLTTGLWKDHNSAVDHVLPNEVVKSANPSVGSGSGPTKLAVRGRFISQLLCGSQLLSGGNNEQPGNPNNQDPEDQGVRKKCIKQGIESAANKVKIKDLRGNKTDLRNAKITEVSGTGSSVAKVTKTNPDGSIELEVDKASGGFLGKGDGDLQFFVEGKKKPDNEWKSPNATQRPMRTNMGVGPSSIWTLANELNAMLPPTPQGGGGGGGSAGSGASGSDQDKQVDEPDPIRLEMWVDDPDLQAEFGVVGGQVDNLYVSDFETLFDLCIRKFQEFKMVRKTWQVETPYLPCLKVNDVITFTTPDGSNTITGRLAQINITYSASGPKAIMSLTVQSFEDIGSTVYVSQNLLVYPNLCGTNGVHWLATIDPTGVVWMMGGYVAIGGGGAGSNVRQPIILEGGITYTVGFVVTRVSGSLTFSIPESSVSNVYGSTTTASFTFVATAGLNTLTWSVPAGTGWYMAFPTLTKTVTR